MTKLKVALFAAALSGCVDQPDDGSTSFQVDKVERADNGVPYFVRGTLGQVQGDLLQSPDALAAALPAIADTLGVGSSQLHATRVERDNLGMTHVRLAQHKNGLRVVSGEAILHLDDTNTIRSVDSGVIDRDLPATPRLAAADASRTAVRDTRGHVAAQSSELVYVVSNRDGELYLAWQVMVVGGADGLPVQDFVYVDALDGRVVDRHPQVFTAKARVIQNGNNGVFPVANAPVVGTEGQPPTDAVALAAYTNTGITHDCYQTLYQRDSYNGAGATMTSQVHVTFNFGGPQPSPNNAVWSAQNQMMAFGDGDGQLMSPLAYSLDVTAHELTHAVTSSTANLIYQNESGALNESMSDIIGAVCQAWSEKAVNANTWLIGEDIWTPNTPGDALRYMASPTLDMQSTDNYAERYQGTQDAGGVHLNSGIPNLAFYLLSVGGQHPRQKTTVTVPAIGIERAGAIFQRALTTKWTANTNMLQSRTGLEQSADELFPGSCSKIAVGQAYAAVGIGAPVPADTVPPTAVITSPANGAKVASGFQVQAEATDNQCINKVELLVDGVVVETLTAAPFTFTTDPNLASGAHTIEVKSYDAFGSATATAAITVNGGGNGDGDGDGDGDGNDITGGCSTGGSGGTLLLALGLLGLVIRRRR